MINPVHIRSKSAYSFMSDLDNLDSHDTFF